MKHFTLALTVPMFLLFVLPFQTPEQTKQSPAKEHKLLVKKIKNQWKVVLESDTNSTQVRGKRGDKIVWTAEGTDAYFQFMDTKLFGDYTRHLKSGQKLILVIGANAKTGINEYAVFCYTDKQYATGDSPPKIIIE